VVGPKSKRRAASHLIEEKSCSERKACSVSVFSRSVYRRKPLLAGKDKVLRERLRSLSAEHPRYGFRRIWGLLRAEGWRVNKKKVQRLWREEGLRVSVRGKKRRRLGQSTAGALRGEYPNHVWSWDFVFDVTADGRQLKILGIVDEFTRQCVALLAGRSFRAGDVIAALEAAMGSYGTPALIRSDNGPEFIAKAIGAHLEHSNIGTNYIERCSPWENAYIESFNGRLRDECLNRELLGSVLEAQVLLDDWREEYNKRRPHGPLGYQSPTAFALNWKGKSSLLTEPVVTARSKEKILVAAET
jgi:putative transposase